MLSFYMYFGERRALTVEIRKQLGSSTCGSWDWACGLLLFLLCLNSWSNSLGNEHGGVQTYKLFLALIFLRVYVFWFGLVILRHGLST